MNSCTVHSYTANNWDQIPPLLENWPFKPLAGHDAWDASDLFDFSCERVKNALGSDQGGAWIVQDQNRVRGFAHFSMMPWDSEQLDIRTARIDYLIADGSYAEQRKIKKVLLDTALPEIQGTGVRYLSVRLDASDLSSLHVLEEAGFITVDGLLTFALNLAKHRPTVPADDFIIRLATAEDANQAAALARTAYLYDRFHSDPFINSDLADELHATWVHNSCTGKAADAVLIAEDEGGLLGFVSCSLQQDAAQSLGRTVGTIVLVAVAERARGRGVGYATTLAALEWFRQQGCEVVEVGTQLRNIPASRLYQKCGFGLVGSSI